MSKKTTIGDRIRESREFCGLTQTQLSLKCGWKRQGRISNYENGKRVPQTKDMMVLANALLTTAAYLEYGEEPTIVVNGSKRSQELSDGQADRLYEVTRFVDSQVRNGKSELSSSQFSQVVVWGFEDAMKNGKVDERSLKRMIRTFSMS